jgi:hypothetical protein
MGTEERRNQRNSRIEEMKNGKTKELGNLGTKKQLIIMIVFSNFG